MLLYPSLQTCYPLTEATKYVGYCWILASLVLFLCVFGPVESLNIILTWSCPQSFTLHQLMSSPCPTIGIRVTDLPPTILPTKGNNIKMFRVRWLGTKIEFSTRHGRHVSRTEVKTLEGVDLTVKVTPTNTVEELKAMLRKKTQGEDPTEHEICQVEVLAVGLLIDY